MLRRLPPLNALKAFEAAARSESITRAAEELGVTQGAVSQQVKALEATLGVKLFNRERQRLFMTQACREYLTVVPHALDRISVGTERLVRRQNSGVLTISTSPDFAALYPRDIAWQSAKELEKTSSSFPSARRRKKRRGFRPSAALEDDDARRPVL